MAAATCLVPMLTFAPAVSAHPAGVFYKSKYNDKRDHPRVIFVAMTRPQESNAKEGMRTWNAVSGRFTFKYSDLTLLPGPNTKVCEKFNLDGITYSRVEMLNLDGPGGYAGVTAVCNRAGSNIPPGQKGRAAYFDIFMDALQGWHYGEKAPPARLYDFQGAVTHELGHATGWGPHYNDRNAAAGICNVTVVAETMCNANYAGNFFFVRTLGSHDMHTFSNAY